MSTTVYLAPPATAVAAVQRQNFSASAVTLALQQLLSPQFPRIHTTPQPRCVAAAELELQTLQPLDARYPNHLTAGAKLLIRTCDSGTAGEALASFAAGLPLPPQTVGGVVFHRVNHRGLQHQERMLYGRRQLEYRLDLELVVDVNDSSFSPGTPETPCPAPPSVAPELLERILCSELAARLAREPDQTIFRGELPPGKDGVGVRFVRFMNAADPLDAATAVLALDLRERRRDDLLETLGKITAGLPKYDWEQENFTIVATELKNTVLVPLRETGAAKQQATLLLELAIIARNNGARDS